MTPAELETYAEGRGKRFRDEAEVRRQDDYLLASLIRIAVWEKKFPAYNDLFAEAVPDSGTGPMDDDALYAKVRALNMMFGGTEE